MFNLLTRKFIALSLVATTLGIGAQILRASNQDTLRFSFVATATSTHGSSVLVGDQFIGDITFDLNSLSTSSSNERTYFFNDSIIHFALTAHPSNTGSWNPAGATWNINPANVVAYAGITDQVIVQIQSSDAPDINSLPFHDIDLAFGYDPRAFDAQEHSGSVNLAQWLGTRSPDLSFASFYFQLREDSLLNDSATYTVSQVVNYSTTTTSTTTLAVRAASVDAPQSTSYKAGNKNVTVHWSAVTGAASYVVTNSAGATQCTSTTNSCVVSNLKNGKAYTYRVFAVNADGVQSTTSTTVRVVSGFQVKTTAFKVKKTVKLSSIVTTPSKGKKSWRVTKGSCRVRGANIVMPTKKGSCTLRLSTTKKGAYAAMSTSVKITAFK